MKMNCSKTRKKVPQFFADLLKILVMKFVLFEEPVVVGTATIQLKSIFIKMTVRKPHDSKTRDMNEIG